MGKVSKSKSRDLGNLSKKKATEKKQQPTKVKQEPLQIGSFGKFLGSSEKVIRDRALDILIKTLLNSSATPTHYGDFESAEKEDPRFTEEDLDRLWQGLIYSFWMQDKPLLQEEMAERLSSIITQLGPSKASDKSQASRLYTSLMFLDGFYRAIIREWTNLDRFRMDKFYMLIRKFQYSTFELLEELKWDRRAIEKYNSLLKQRLVNMENPKLPASLIYHMADIYLDEFAKFAQPESNLPLWDVLEPFNEIMKSPCDSVMYNKLLEAIYEPLIKADGIDNKPTHDSSEGESDANDDEDDPIDRLVTYSQILSLMPDAPTPSSQQEAILSNLFALGSKTENDYARKRLYTTYRNLKK